MSLLTEKLEWRIASCATVIFPAVTLLFIAMQYYVFITMFWEAMTLKRKRIGDSLACKICVNVGLPALSDALSNNNPWSAVFWDFTQREMVVLPTFRNSNRSYIQYSRSLNCLIIEDRGYRLSQNVGINLEFYAA